MKNDYKYKTKRKKVNDLAKAILKYRQKRYTKTILRRPTPYHEQAKEFVVGEVKSLPIEILVEALLERRR